MASNLEQLKASLLKPGASGLRREIIQELGGQGVRVFYLDGEQIGGKKQFLEKAAKVMGFPDYFGQNWDAFEDCLTDLAWAPAKEYIVVYDHIEKFADAEPEQAQTALGVLNSAAEFWAEKNIPMHLVLAEHRKVFGKKSRDA